MTAEEFSKMVALKVLQFNEGNIAIKGRTVVFMPVEIIISMHELVGKSEGIPSADELLCELGRYQTITGSRKYFEQKNDLKKTFSRVPMTGDPAMEMGRAVLKFAGWGDSRIEEIREKGHTIIMRTINSPIAEEYIKTRGKCKVPVCHYLRGLLAGVFESVYGIRYNVEETSCRATGLSKDCIFCLKIKE